MSETWTVGYDGSKSSHNALRWAFSIASPRNVTISAVTAIEPSILEYANAYVVDLPLSQVTTDVKIQARSELAAAIDTERRGSDSPVELIIADGPPARTPAPLCQLSTLGGWHPRARWVRAAADSAR